MISIYRELGGGYWVDGKPFMPDNVHLYRKTTLARAVRMREPFQVETRSGIAEGKAGDWLMISATGEMYPCDAEIFAATYILESGLDVEEFYRDEDEQVGGTE